MSFLETPRFPEDISYGATVGPEWSTHVVEVASGHEQRNQNWSAARFRADVSHGVKRQTQLDALIAFFRAVRGRAHGFRFKDWTDFRTTVADGLLGTGVGTGGATYQLGKSYVAGALSELRAITKPVSGTVTIYKNATPVAFGGGAGQVALDYTTGIATFGTPLPTGSDALTWAGEFDVPCRFDTDRLDAEIISRMRDGTLVMSWSGVPVIEVRV